MTVQKPKNHRKASQSPQGVSKSVKVGKRPTAVKGHIGRPIKNLDLPVYDSIGQCAAATGIPRSLLKREKRDGCPAFRSNRVYLKEFLIWICKKMFGTAEPPPGCTSWGDALNQERAIAEREDRERRAGKLMETAEAKRQAKEAMHFVFAGYDRLKRELPPLLKGCTEVEIETSLGKQFESERKNAEEKFNAVGTSKAG